MFEFDRFACLVVRPSTFFKAMQIYKVTFIKNKIDSCKVSADTIMEGSFTCEKHNGFLIYALIKAESETKAREKALELVEQVSLK